MPTDVRVIGAFLLALSVGYLLTPVAMRVAVRTAFFDHPAGYKGHTAPTPYLGGAAVLVAFCLAATIATPQIGRFLPVVVGACVLWAVGTVDDRKTVPPAHRVVVEMVVASSLWAVGWGWSLFSDDVLNLVLTNLWTVGIVNAFNLMDNMDGAASSVAAASALGIAVLALTAGDDGTAITALALCGACLGFLPHNLKTPARIFLGDGGSMLIGFVVATLAMRVPALDHSLKWSAGLAAVLLVGLPILDTTLVTISRRRRRVPLLKGGRDHLTHRLLRPLRSARLVAGTLAAVQGGLALTAVIASHLGPAQLATLTAIYLVLGAVTVLLLERAAGASLAWEGGGGVGPHATPAVPAAPGRRALSMHALLLSVIALACGVSVFFGGFYAFSTWGPIALVVLTLFFGLFLAERVAPRGPALFALLGLVGLWGWSLLSTRWSESVDRALTESNRWMLYIALFAALLLLLKDRRLARIVLAVITASIVAVALYVVATMVFGDGQALFLGGRLNKPLGYVNSQGLYFLLGFWPLVAVAEHSRRALTSCLAVAGATLLAALLVLSEARGVALALVVSAAVILILVPGRRRRAWVLLAVAAGVVAVAPSLFDVYRLGTGGQAVAGSTIRHAGELAVLVAALAGLCWAGATTALSAVASRRPEARRHIALASTSTLIALAILGSGLALASASRIAHRVDIEAHAFVHLQGSSGDTRLASGGGNRYDYWRIAFNEFRAQPLRGVGAGNYDKGYFLQRRTTEDIRQPHSMELQALAELGVVGVLGLGCFVFSVLFGLHRRARRGRADHADRLVAVAAGGAFVAWTAHASVDWSHLLPGVAGLALCFAALLVAPLTDSKRKGGPDTERGSQAPSRRWPILAVRSVVSVSVALAALTIVRPLLADYYRRDAATALVRNPSRALAGSNESLAFDDRPLPTYYLKAAAFGRLGNYEAARGTLLEAARLEPHSFVTWALLGDLAMRHGDNRAAQVSYRRALGLNPREPGLVSGVRAAGP